MQHDVPRKSARYTRKGRERRTKILEVAAATFREHGFEAASMSQIAALAGGSKGTLYNYFPSKEDLLLATMLAGAQDYTDKLLIALDPAGDTREQLALFLAPLLTTLYSHKTAQLLRVAISVGGKTDIGRRFFDVLDDDIWSNVAQFFKAQGERGCLCQQDPQLMCLHLRCLCESELIPLLMGAVDPWDSTRVDQEVKHISDIFMLAYGRTPPKQS